MDPLAELEEEQAVSDRQVDEGDAVEGATRPTSARESRQAFSVGEAVSGQVDSDLVAEIDALAEGIEATEAGVDDVSLQVDVNLQSSRRGASPKTRRRSRRQSLEDSSMASTKDDAAEADFYKEEPSRMFSRGATGAGEGEVQVAVEPATILDSPSKTKKRNSKVAPKVFQKRDSQVSISHKQSTAFPGIEEDFDWTSGRNGGTLGHHGATTFKSFPMIQDVKDEWESEGRDLVRKPNFKAVGIRVEIFRIYDIVAAESHFTCDFEVFMEWCDPSIIGIHSLDSSKQPGGRNNVGCFDPQGGWKPAWTPHLLFHNQYDRLNIWCKKYHVVDRAIGRVSSKLGFRGQFYDVMDMKQFPFDRQVLHVVIASEHPLAEMEYVQHPSGKQDTMLYENLAEWSLYNPKSATLLTPVTYHDVLGDNNVGFQRYILQIRVERRYMYFVYNVFAPIFSMSVLSMTTWSINPTIAGERLAATFTLLLSLIAFKFAIAQHIPLVPYLTYLDMYVMLSFLFMVMVAIENAICAQLPEDPWDDSPDPLQIKFDRYFFSIFGGAWILFNIVLVFVAMKGYLFQEYVEIEDNDETRTVQAHPDDGGESGDDPLAEDAGIVDDAATASPRRQSEAGKKFVSAARVTVGATKMKRGIARGSTKSTNARRSNSGSLNNNKGSIIGAQR